MSRVETIMNIALQITANLTIAFAPFLPRKAAQIERYLAIEPLTWNEFGSTDILKIGHQINPEKPAILIAKIDAEFVAKQVAKLEASKNDNASTNFPPQKDTIDFEDFTKLDIRVGQILTAERVPKADKLLKLTVDLGIDKRTIVSGIAEHFEPESVIGKKVSVLINLAPRKIRGVESEGMILMAENTEGKLDFVSPNKEFETGSEIR
jgi:methionyl-tRNA synthetase